MVPRPLALSHDLLIAAAPLSPIQRRVTHLLLTENSEKSIAEKIGKSRHMTHKYVTEIFRKFGVNSRAASWRCGWVRNREVRPARKLPMDHGGRTNLESRNYLVRISSFRPYRDND